MQVGENRLLYESREGKGHRGKSDGESDGAAALDSTSTDLDRSGGRDGRVGQDVQAEGSALQ